jgi:hypothetical protein
MSCAASLCIGGEEAARTDRMNNQRANMARQPGQNIAMQQINVTARNVRATRRQGEQKCTKLPLMPFEMEHRSSTQARVHALGVAQQILSELLIFPESLVQVGTMLSKNATTSR